MYPLQISGNGGGFYWGISHLIDILQTFLDLTGATTVPSLEEYRILPDKVRSCRITAPETQSLSNLRDSVVCPGFDSPLSIL
jgi:arylsulfatase A-like enzyme